MPQHASPALLMLAMLFTGCASVPEARDDAMSADQLYALVFGAQQPKSLDDLQGRQINVRGKVDLRYGGQQLLLADGEGAEGGCVQLIVPEAINRSFFSRRFHAHIEGSLLVFPTPADGDIYVHYKVNGVLVYPACAESAMVFLEVAKLTKD